MNRGLTYLEIVLGVAISALIFWISINLMSFVLLRDISQAYIQEFENAKAQVHELLSNEIAWANELRVTGENSFSVDGVLYEVRDERLTKNGKDINLKNVLIDNMTVGNLSDSDEVAIVQVEFTLRHEKSNSIFDTVRFVVSQRRKAILKNG